MKRLAKVFLLSISLLLMMNTVGDAKELAPPNVELLGNANGIIFIPGDKPFLEFNNMLPGDKVKRKLIIENKFTDSYEIYLRAERLSPKEEFDLLEKLNMTIKYEGETIHHGDALGEQSLKENILIGTVNPNEKKELIAEVELDGESTGNEYKNKKGEVKWVFTAVRKPVPLPSGGLNGSNQGQVGGSIGSNSSDVATSPKTGDEGILKYLILLLMCIIGFKVINKKEGRVHEKN